MQLEETGTAGTCRSSPPTSPAGLRSMRAAPPQGARRWAVCRTSRRRPSSRAWPSGRSLHDGSAHRPDYSGPSSLATLPADGVGTRTADWPHPSLAIHSVHTTHSRAACHRQSHRSCLRRQRLHSPHRPAVSPAPPPTPQLQRPPGLAAPDLSAALRSRCAQRAHRAEGSSRPHLLCSPGSSPRSRKELHRSRGSSA